MKTLFFAIAGLFFTNYCLAQHVYQIRADTVRIYNTCDTAELVLENRTRDTLGFLFNKGKGRTEFRRLGLERIGASQLAITGQDTLDLDFSSYGDTRYDLLSTNFVTIPAGSSWLFGQWPLKKVVGYDAYNSPDMPALSNQAIQGSGGKLYYNGLVVRDETSGFDLAVNWDGELNGPNGVFVRTKDDTKTAWSNWRELLFKDYADTTYISKTRTLTIANGTGISVTPNTAQDLSANRSWTITNTGVTSINGATGAVTVAPATGSGSYIQNQSSAVQSSSAFWINGTGKMLNLITTVGTSPTGAAHYYLRTSDIDRWKLGLQNTESGSNTGSDFKLWRYDDTGTYLGTVLTAIRTTGVVDFGTTPTAAGNTIWHAGNHVAGATFAPTLTGANVLSTLTTNAAGHVTALTTRTLTASDIGAAPANGGGGYIQNQSAEDQSATFRINGEGRSSSSLTVTKNGSNTILGSFVLYNTARTRGANLQLDANTNPGLNFWIHDGTTWQNRMTIGATGNVGIGTSSPSTKLFVNGTTTLSGNTTITGGLTINSTNPLVTLSDGTNTNAYIQLAGGRLDFNNANAYTSFTGAAKVGIGITAPAEKLDVAGNINIGAANAFKINGINVIYNPVDITTNGVYISSRVIGNNSTAIQDGMYLNYNSTGTTAAHLRFYANGTTERMRIDASTGNVGIGISAPAAKLEVAGQVQATSFFQSSLRSLKKDIRPFTQSALQVFEKVQVRTFKFKADSTGKTNIGFIADEVPDQMATPKRNGVDQASTVALLVKAVQELSAQNKAMQQEIRELKQQLKGEKPVQ